MKNTFDNIFLDYGFVSKRNAYGVRMYYNKNKDYYASIDDKARVVRGRDYEGYSIQEVIDFLKSKGFKKEYSNGGGVEEMKMKNGGLMKKWDEEEYRYGGSISSDRRFTEWDFNKLMASDKFEAVWSGNLWKINEAGRTTVLGKFNPKTKSLYISGDKNMDNFLVVWMTENGFVNSNEYTILANGGGIERIDLFDKDELINIISKNNTSTAENEEITIKKKPRIKKEKPLKS